MPSPLVILIGRPDPALHSRVAALSDQIRIVTSEELRDQPDLIRDIEVSYAGLRRPQFLEATGLRWIQLGGAGVNGVLDPVLRERDVVVTNASGIHAEPITEHMFAMLLMVTRKLHLAWEQQQSRVWQGFDFNAASSGVGMLAGRTLGVLGVGAIGGHSARVGKAFGMRVIGCRRTGEPHPDVETMFRQDDALDFFRQSDVVMNSLPLTEKTRHFMGWDVFREIKPGSIVINTGRGGTILTDALVDALRERRIGAALLDVTDPEPLPTDHPLWSMENVYITSHYSGAHLTYWERADCIFLDNLRRYLSGEPMINVVDQDEGY